jgi:hypothetical protein
MTASLHLGIRDAVAALYQAATALAGNRIHENRNFPLAEGVASQIQVFRLQSVPERLLLGPTAPIDWVTDIRTVIKARTDGATSAEAAADAIAVAAYARVMADQTLGGLCEQIEPGTFEWDQAEADSNVVQVSWDIQVRHRSYTNAIS